MRCQQEIALRMLRARREAQVSNSTVARSEAEALAWALGVDLDHMEQYKIAAELAGFDHVVIELVVLSGERFWFVWIPANPHPSYRTEGFGIFVSDEHMRQLAVELNLALTPGARCVAAPAGKRSAVYAVSPGGADAAEGDGDVLEGL